jgi:hypothetical protein
MSHPSTGPLTPEQLKELAQAPFGAGREAIREHDPYWGRARGEKFKWRVEVSTTACGEAYVMAEDEEEAEELADALDDSAIEYTEFGRLNVVRVKPA